jgi:hypothetical protein
MARLKYVIAAVLAVMLTAAVVSAQAPPPPDGGTDSTMQVPEGFMPCLFAQGDEDTARPGPGMGMGRPEGPHGRRMMEQQRKHLEQFRMFELLKLLDLKEDQEVEFLTMYKNYRDKQNDIDSRRRDLVIQLGAGLEADSLSDNEIQHMVQEIFTLNTDKVKAAEQFVKEAGDVLTTQQMGKLVVFQERFEYELLSRLRGFRERNQMEGR